MNPHLKALMAFALLGSLTGCAGFPTQAVYEEIRAQEKAKAIGTGAAPGSPLPRYDQYQKERSELSNDKP